MIPEVPVRRPMNLSTSSMRTTGKATTNTNNHSLKLSGTIPNTFAKNGMYSIKKCKPNETDIARRSHGLTQGGIVSRLVSSDKAFNELNISIATKTERERVVAFTLPDLK